MYKQKFSAEIKVRTVESILEGKTTQGKAADLLDVNKATIQGWIHIYQTFGPEGLAPRKTAQILTSKEKKAAVEDYLRGQGSLADVCKQHGIRSKCALRKWVEQYNNHIEFRAPSTNGAHRSEVYMRSGKSTTQMERIEMVSCCIDHGMNYALVVEQYGVSYNQIYSWVKKFQESGVAGLEDRRGKKRLVPEMSEVEQLRAENKLLKKKAERLELENKEISTRGYAVKEICEIFGASRSGYYKWTNREKSRRECENEQLLQELKSIYHTHNGTYGYRRLTDEFNCIHGTNYNIKRLHRLTKAVGLQAIIRRTKPNYKKSDPEVTAANILNRDFSASKPNEKWLTDVTEMKYGNGQRLYLSAIMDLHGRDIISYVIQRKNNNALVFDTFDRAAAKYPDAHPIFHSDRGFQYTNRLFKAKLDACGMTQSMSRVGRCIDNAPMEGFWGILKCEMYYLHRFETYGQLKAAIERFIFYYNHQRRQHRLNCLPPAQYRCLTEKIVS